MNKSGLYFLLILLEFFIFNFLTAQTVQKKLTFQYLQGHYIRKSNYLFQTPIDGFSFSYSRRIKEDLLWRKKLNYPNVGFGYSFLNLKNKNTGYMHNLFLDYGFNILSYKKLSLNFNIGVGLNYTTKVYDSLTNPLSNKVSSHINFYAFSRFNLGYLLTKKVRIFTAYSFLHASNGKVKDPNLGYNFLTYDLGVDIFFNTVKKNKYSNKDFVIRDSIYTKTKQELDISASSFFKASQFSKSSKVFSGDIFLAYRRRLNNLFWLGVGLDFFYDASQIKPNKDYNNNPHYFTSLNSIFEFRFTDKLSYNIQIGILLHNSEVLKKGLIINRLGVRYRINDKWFIKGAIKSQLFVALQWELGMGFSIFNK